MLVKIKSLNIELKEIDYIDSDECNENNIALLFVNGYENANDIVSIVKEAYSKIYVVFY